MTKQTTTVKGWVIEYRAATKPDLWLPIAAPPEHHWSLYALGTPLIATRRGAREYAVEIRGGRRVRIRRATVTLAVDRD